MKRTFLLTIGITSATILVVMALWILLTGTFYLFPTITINSVSGGSVDGNGMLVLTGTTNLALNTFLFVNVSPASMAGGAYETEITSVAFGSGGRNSWRAVVNTSALPMGEYSVRVSTVTFSGDERTTVPGNVVATERLTLTGRRGESLPEPFFRVNTPGEGAAGERIKVTGTTNLPPGTSVVWKVNPVLCLQNGTSSAEPAAGSIPVAEGRSTISPGLAGVNRWSFTFDSMGMAAGCYRVTVAGDLPPGNETESTAVIVLSTTGTLQVPSRFISIDTLPDLEANTMTVLTGTTSLPSGEELLVEISPLLGSGYGFIVNPGDGSQGALFSGMIGTAAVEEGGGEANLWSMGIDTYRLPPGKYRVNVSNSKTNRTTYRIEPGDVYSVLDLVVRSGTP